MNFLSHYYFCKTEDPYYNTGLVLPDLVKNFCHSHLKPEGHFNRPALKALQAGSLMHLETDRVFHNSAYFRDICGYFSNVLDAEGTWPRKWFLNHLLCEILTDRVLMDRHPGLCKAFYSTLRHTDLAQVSLFLKMCGVNNYHNFNEGFERFVSVQFIFEYEHNEKIILALGRVYARAGITHEWTETEQTLLNKHVPALLTYIDSKLIHLENELK